MIAIGGVLIFGGYQLLVYGWDQLTGGNAGFFQILVPGRYKDVAPNDPPGAGTATPPPTTTLTGSPIPTTTKPGSDNPGYYLGGQK